MPSIRYVDSAAVGANNGTSWTDAWTTIGAITGLVAGDTVYISGGAAGNTRTYNMSAYWNPTSGSAGNKITYKIGQDSAHNGTVIFNYTGVTPAGNPWVSGTNYAVFSGDAGDNGKHFRLTGYTLGVSNISNTTLEYVDADAIGFTQFADVRSSGSSTAGCVIQYCTIRITDTNASNAIFSDTTGATGSYTAGLVVANNTFNLLYRSTLDGFGVDGVDFTGDGITIRDNAFIGFSGAYTGGQHQDGIQSTGGTSYTNIRIYGNDFIDMTNYAVYGEALTAGFTDVYVYNNLARLVNSALTARTTLGGFIFGINGSTNRTFLRVVIDNNVIVDYGTTSPAIALNDVDSSAAATFTDCSIKNNALVNSGPIDITGNSTTIPVTNATLSAAVAPSKFLAYATNSLSNNFSLAAGSSTLIGVGTDESAYFTTDRLGATRTVPWDLGAYKWLGLAGRPNVSGIVYGGFF